MTFVKTNLSGYFKDPATGFIVNRNEADFKLYETQKQLYKERIRAEIETRKALGEIEDLKKQMQEFKEMLQSRKADSNG